MVIFTKNVLKKFGNDFETVKKIITRVISSLNFAF